MCAAYRHSPLYGIDDGRPQPHSHTMAGRRKRPWITRDPFVRSTEPTHRRRRDQHEVACYFLVADGFVTRQVLYSYAREARSPLSASRHLQQHDQADTLRAHLWFRPSDQMHERCNLMNPDTRTRRIWFSFS